jgi:hypothetical protein
VPAELFETHISQNQDPYLHQDRAIDYTGDMPVEGNPAEDILAEDKDNPVEDIHTMDPSS